jgi:hypothetical protein
MVMMDGGKYAKGAKMGTQIVFKGSQTKAFRAFGVFRG